MVFESLRVRLIAIALSVLAVLPAVGTLHAQQRTIAVVGEGVASHDPEQATLSLNVTSQDVTAVTVFTKHHVAMQRLKQSLQDAGAASTDISEGTLIMNPTYDYSAPGQPPRLVGYHLMTPITVTVKDLRTLPTLLDAATGAGASNAAIGGFALHDAESLRDAATKDALKDARERAEALAKQIGAQVGEIVSVSDMEAEAPGKVEMERDAMSGTKNVRQKVELKVVFALK